MTQNELQEDGGSRRSVHVWCVSVIVIIALAQMWATRFEMNEDGISYLEIGWAYAHQPLTSAISTYWNPLYPVLLAPVLAVSRPSPSGEFVIVHVVNFLIFALSLCAFAFFFKRLEAFQRLLYFRPAVPDVSPWVWQMLGYALFLSCTLDLLTVTLVSPDLLVSALVFGSMGLLLHSRGGANSSYLSMALLGILLGLGYLAKPVMLLFALLILGVATAKSLQQREGLRQVALTGLLFLVIAAPYITFISWRAGRFTISDNGSLTYLFVVSGQPYGYSHGVDLPVGSKLKHPPQLLFQKPAVYEFSASVKGSCPMWYDPSYWYDGIRMSFNPARQARQIVKNIWTFLRVLSSRQAPLCAALLTLLFFAGDLRNAGRRALKQWMILIPATVLIVLNALFNLEARLIAPYLTVLWACCLGSFRFGMGKEGTRFLQSTLIAGAVLLVFGAGVQIERDAANAWRGVSTEDRHSTRSDRAVAAGLAVLGVPQDSSVAYVGDSISAYWAHLAGVRIVAEVPVEDQTVLLNAPKNTMDDVLVAMSKAGALAVIAPGRPKLADEGWKTVPGTEYYMHFLPR